MPYSTVAHANLINCVLNGPVTVWLPAQSTDGSLMPGIEYENFLSASPRTMQVNCVWCLIIALSSLVGATVCRDHGFVPFSLKSRLKPLPQRLVPSLLRDVDLICGCPLFSGNLRRVLSSQKVYVQVSLGCSRRKVQVFPRESHRVISSRD